MGYKISNKVKYIHKILCETEKIYYSMLKHAQITDSEYVLLFSLLESDEGCSQKDIADNTYISTKTLNSAVKKLEQKGLISLTRAKYPNMILNLTPKGKEYVKEKMIPLIETENKILQNVSDKDFENFTALVAKYMDMFSGFDSPKPN